MTLEIDVISGNTLVLNSFINKHEIRILEVTKICQRNGF